MTLFGGLIHSWYSKTDTCLGRYEACLPIIAAHPTLMMTSRLSLVSDQHMTCRRILTRGGYDTPCNCNSRRQVGETLERYSKRINASRTAVQPIRTILQVDVNVACGSCEIEVPSGQILAHCDDCKHTVCWQCRSANHQTCFYTGLREDGTDRWVLPPEHKTHPALDRQELPSTSAALKFEPRGQSLRFPRARSIFKSEPRCVCG